MPRSPDIRLALAGALLTTASGGGRSSRLLIAELVGLFNNPYAGLVVFVAVPALLVLGLLLIPFGMWLEQPPADARTRAPTRSGRHRLPVGRRSAARALLIVALTAVNIVIVLLAGYGSLHSMESPVVLRPGVPHADASAVHRVAGRAALAGRVRAMPHR